MSWFSRILEKFHFSISISRHFHFTFHSRSRSWDIFISLFTLGLDIKAFSFHFSFSKWVNQIFISLFTSRNEWTKFSFHFSLLELPISTLAGHWSGFGWTPGGVGVNILPNLQSSMLYLQEAILLQQVPHDAHFHPAVLRRGGYKVAHSCGHAIKLRLHHHCHSLPESSK